MKLAEYQRRAHETASYPATDAIGFLIHGLAGAAGSLASEYKKLLRDGPAHLRFADQIAEGIGDSLWYLAELATEVGVDLDQVALDNLTRCQDRWAPVGLGPDYLDDDAPESERLPRQFAVRFRSHGRYVEIVDSNGRQIGDRLNDNAARPDGYRFHDAFHIAHAAVLGWSPVLRSLLRRKRKYDSGPGGKDEVEDGARAVAIEEAVSAFVFRVAERSNWFENVDHVDSDLLRAVRLVVGGLEVSVRSSAEWEIAIVQGYEAWRALCAHNGGVLHADLDLGTVTFSCDPDEGGPAAET